jgi:hypothetical protein
MCPLLRTVRCVLPCGFKVAVVGFQQFRLTRCVVTLRHGMVFKLAGWLLMAGNVVGACAVAICGDDPFCTTLLHIAGLRVGQSRRGRTRLAGIPVGRGLSRV